MPKTIGLHCEKVAVMCDNGQVRWIPVKGMGIDMKSKELMDLKVNISFQFPCKKI
jgi:hypothetical protein